MVAEVANVAAMARMGDLEIESNLQASPWRREGAEIVRDREFGDFAAALAFVNRVAEAAETANHHPDILVHGARRVRLRLTDHSAGGLSDKDFALARSIDALD